MNGAMDLKIVDIKREPVIKRAAALDQLTDGELAAWEEAQREQRRQYLEHLRKRGRLI